MNCELQFGQVVVWRTHKSTWQICFSGSDTACHWVTSDVNRKKKEKAREGKEGRRRRNWSTELVKTNFWSILFLITGNGCSLSRLAFRLLIFFFLRFKKKKKQGKNYGSSPLWLSSFHPLLLFCASFHSKTSIFFFVSVLEKGSLNSMFEEIQWSVGLPRSFLSQREVHLPLHINLLRGLLDIVRLYFLGI